MFLKFAGALFFFVALSSGAEAATICTSAAQNTTASLTCPTGSTMTWISFASYGQPSGTTCSTYKVGTCHATTSQSVVNAACKGKSSCKVAATDAVFGKPCSGTKRLAIRADCTPTASPTPTPAPSWVHCANEGGTCNFTGIRNVRYGANGVYFTKTAVQAPIACNNTYFGDPLKSVAKTCAYSSTVVSPSPSPSPSASPSPSPTPQPSPSPTPIAKRDPIKQPFKSTSIWNMPIGSNAVYVNANISGSPAGNIWAKMPGADHEHIILTPNAPEEDIRRSNVGWSGGDRCVYTSTEILGRIPIPDGYLVQNSRGNNSTAALMKDGRTILQFQPITRCTFGGYITSYTTPIRTDIYGDGIPGSHGGSGLSAIGGSIRMGELRPGSLEGPRHVLKVNVWAAAVLYNCSTRADCYRWPASTGDSYAVSEYGTYNNNLNTAMKMGTLLAIPRSVAISTLGLETTPAKQLAWTLQNYGAYIVDDTATPGFDFNLETGPNGSKAMEFETDWGFPFVQKVEAAGRSPWVRDIQRLVQALKAVNNNSATTIGGGGTPLQPLAPEIVAPAL